MSKTKKEMCENLLHQLDTTDWVGDSIPSWKYRFDERHPAKVYGLKVCMGHAALNNAGFLRVQAVDHDLEPVTRRGAWFSRPAAFTSFVRDNQLIPVKDTYFYGDFPAVVLGAASDWGTDLPTVDWVQRLLARTRAYYVKMIEDESYPESWQDGDDSE